jgi:hypothetical protein
MHLNKMFALISLQLLSETFLVLTIHGDIINVYLLKSLCKCPLSDIKFREAQFRARGRTDRKADV